MKLSAVVITFNEERNIARCLQSLQGVADEIVVVDSFSTDKTEEICKSLGAKFFSQKWLGYGAQKNMANMLATGDYILSLDADEALSDTLQQEILALKQRADADAYSMNRLTNYCGQWIKHCGWYPDRKIRLWKRGTAEWNLDKVHEKIVLNSAVKAQHLAGDILHYSYYSIDEHIRQANLFAGFGAQKLCAKRKVSFAQMLYKPLWRFVRTYFVNLGFLDGFYGFVICNISAFETFLKYVRAKQLQLNS